MGIVGRAATKTLAGPPCAGHHDRHARPQGPLAFSHAGAMAAELGAPERIVLFCIASGTSLAKAVVGNTSTVRSRLIVRGFIERNSSRFVITDQGATLLAKHDKGG